jgi:hypothetical protein
MWLKRSSWRTSSEIDAQRFSGVIAFSSAVVAIVMFLRIECFEGNKKPAAAEGCGAGYGNSSES